ncbi:MAG: helix-turn-helix domain-containing protein [Clostridiales bacterium]|nr:helix-turn-helix domain-containing protein [Clostridiales bacterium]
MISIKNVFYEQREQSVFIGPFCDHPFPAHVHDMVEIICLLSGKLKFSVAAQSYSLKPGDVIAAFPSVPHSYDVVSDDARGICLIFSPETINEFSRAFRTMLPVNPLIEKSQQAPEIEQLIKMISKMCQQEDSPLKLGYLHLFLSYLFTCMPLRQMDKNIHSSLSHQVLHYISEHYTEPLSLESTSRALGISRIHLSHIFSQQLKINFRQYINTLRINHACSLLQNPGYSISEISYMCGYENPRTFHRAFLSVCQTTPNKYRNRLFGETGNPVPTE